MSGPTLSLESLIKFSPFQALPPSSLHGFSRIFNSVRGGSAAAAEKRIKDKAVEAGLYLGISLQEFPCKSCGIFDMEVRKVKQITKALTQKWDYSQIFITDFGLTINFVYLQVFGSRMCCVHGYWWLGCIAGQDGTGRLMTFNALKPKTVFHFSLQREIKS